MKPSNTQFPFWPGVVLVTVLFPAMSWLRFGNWRFGAALSAFLILLMVAVQYLPGLGDKYAPKPDPVEAKPDAIDQHATQPAAKLGVIGCVTVLWFLSIPFAPCLAWLIGSLSTVNVHTWRLVLGSQAFLCVALPVTCALPLLVLARGPGASSAMLIVIVGTAIPVFFGLPAATDVVRGPQWQAVTVSEARRVHVYTRGRDIPSRDLKVRLDDGRTLAANSEQVDVRTGPCRILLLRGIGQIIGVER
jgi:hypothetical protein